MQKKILIIRFSSIGDIVLTTPVIRAIKKQTGAEVHYLTKRTFRSILDANPYIDKVIAVEKRVGEALPALRREKYDAVVDLHRNLRSLQVKLALYNIPSYSFDKLNAEKWLLVNLRIDRLPHLHIVDRYLAAAAALGITNDGAGLDYFIPPSEEVDAASFLENHLPAPQPGLRNPEPGYVAFVIGAAHATKRLPAGHIAALCGKISLPVILLGGPDDAAAGTDIAAAAGPHVINACGRLSLHQSASLVRQASRVITHDTGLMHVAAAFRKEIISLWGNTVPAFGMYPYYGEGRDRNRTIEVEGLSCRPCSKIGYDRCPKGHFRCMKDIRAEDVLTALES